ncbi:cell wall protein RBR3-like [Salvia miltiorrhiza]|uniref:cell wall protein RBR3-like n=1 Tax=Salvia miltiorrhiza TaxID=226208 RepID=UPI0025AC4682|nr:cell wall protein RBR3-like [Salvia miltiorrhiza]
MIKKEKEKEEREEVGKGAAAMPIGWAAERPPPFPTQSSSSSSSSPPIGQQPKSRTPPPQHGSNSGSRAAAAPPLGEQLKRLPLSHATQCQPELPPFGTQGLRIRDHDLPQSAAPAAKSHPSSATGSPYSRPVGSPTVSASPRRRTAGAVSALGSSSGRRSHLQKQKHMEELMAQVAELHRQNHQILTSLRATTQHHVAVESENAASDLGFPQQNPLAPPPEPPDPHQPSRHPPSSDPILYCLRQICRSVGSSWPRQICPAAATTPARRIGI